MKRFRLLILLLTLVLVAPINEAISITIGLDALTPETGSNLETEPLVTPYGTITFTGGEVYPKWFIHDHAWMPAPYAEFTFDFDIESISFLAYGGAGGILAEAYDINNSLVDSYLTLDDIFKLPVNLSGSGIRTFRFEDGRLYGGNAEITDLVLTTSASAVPEPSTLLLLGSGLFGVGAIRKKFCK